MHEELLPRQEEETVGHTCRRWPGSKQETGKKMGEANRHLRNEQTLVGNWRKLRKKRRAHRAGGLEATVLSLKCRSLGTEVQLCRPRHPKGNTENRRKAQTLGSRANRRTTEMKENVKIGDEEQTAGLLLPLSRWKILPFREALGGKKGIQESFSTGGEPPPCCAAVAPATEALEDTAVLLDRRRRRRRREDS